MGTKTVEVGMKRGNIWGLTNLGVVYFFTTVVSLVPSISLGINNNV